MNEQEILPAGILLLQGIRVDSTISIPTRTFNRIVKILLKCSFTAGPEVIQCDHCFYKKVCIRRFDKLCGKVEKFKVTR